MTVFDDFLQPMRVHIARPTGMLTFDDVRSPPLPYVVIEVAGDPRCDFINLAPPHRILKIFIDDMTFADNFRDLQIDVNPVVHPVTRVPGFVVDFRCDGAYEKWICYDDLATRRLLHHYQDGARESKWGIFTSWDLPLKGLCPVCERVGE